MPMQVPAMAVTGLTKGARRRLQQRLKKKLGKRARQEQLVIAEMVPTSIPVLDVCSGFTLPRAQSVPVPGALMPVPGALMPAGTVPISGSVMVPVCAVQMVPQLEEEPQTEVADALVSLPSAAWQISQCSPVQEEKTAGKASAPTVARATGQEELTAVEASETTAAQATGGEVRASRCGDCESEDAQLLEKLPTVNTFVHFRDVQAPRRRSLSA